MVPERQQAYQTIAKAIAFLERRFPEQPELKDVAASVHLSPYHFQRLFTEWTGISPKKYLQQLSLVHAKSLLRNGGATLLDAAFETGFSGTGRLHDLFVKIDGMTPGEFKKGGAGIAFHYDFVSSPFGELLLVSSPRGLSWLAFIESEEEALEEVRREFPEATFRRERDPHQEAVSRFFQGDGARLDRIKLHLKATPFQFKVWQGLLRIPRGRILTYGELAESIGEPGAARAAGSAIGANPVAYLIPCHRVIRANGEISGYRWGEGRKRSLLAWDRALTEPE